MHKVNNSKKLTTNNGVSYNQHIDTQYNQPIIIMDKRPRKKTKRTKINKVYCYNLLLKINL